MAMPDTGARADLVRTAFLLEWATLYLLIKEGWEAWAAKECGCSTCH